MPERTLPLSSRSLAVARGIARRLFDGGSGVPEEKLDAFLLELADWVRCAGPRTRLALRAGLLLVQLSPPLTLGRLSRYRSLPPEEQLDHLHRLETSPTFALAFAGLKTVFCLLWFEVWGVSDLPAETRTERVSLRTPVP